MPWTVKIDLDEDKTKVGVVTAEYRVSSTDLNPTFVYSKRWAASDAATLTEIVNDAISRRNAVGTRTTRETNIAVSLKAAFDAVEP